VHHALGLALVRLNRNDEALTEFGAARNLDPDQARFAYVYAVALHSSGRLNGHWPRWTRASRGTPTTAIP
jgi:Flp pilus assembly protein TadD